MDPEELRRRIRMLALEEFPGAANAPTTPGGVMMSDVGPGLNEALEGLGDLLSPAEAARPDPEGERRSWDERVDLEMGRRGSAPGGDMARPSALAGDDWDWLWELQQMVTPDRVLRRAREQR